MKNLRKLHTREEQNVMLIQIFYLLDLKYFRFAFSNEFADEKRSLKFYFQKTKYFTTAVVSKIILSYAQINM